MGTLERYKLVTKDIENGLVHAKNLKNKQRAAFLDRDGIINVYKRFIRNEQELELIPGIRRDGQQDAGYLKLNEMLLGFLRC